MTTIKTYSHPFELPLEQTALLIIDMQNDFCHPDGFNGSELGLNLESIRAIIPSIQTLLDWSRQLGLAVIFTRESHPPDLSDLTSSKQRRYTNAGSPIGADYVSRGMQQQLFNQQNMYRDMGLSLAGRQPLAMATTPATSNFASSFTPSNVMNFLGGMGTTTTKTGSGGLFGKLF